MYAYILLVSDCPQAFYYPCNSPSQCDVFVNIGCIGKRSTNPYAC